MSSSYEKTTNGFNFDIVKSSSTSTITSPTSSPSSSTTSNSSTKSIFTKKPRTLRKRPNQTFNEAATLLSIAYPNLFSIQNLKKPEKFTKPIIPQYNDSSEPLLLFRQCNNNVATDDAFSFLSENRKDFQTEPNKVLSLREKKKTCELSTVVVSDSNYNESGDFDCESILDEEMEDTIDSIMGSRAEDDNCAASCHGGEPFSHRYAKALRRVDDKNWWNFSVVDMLQISPQMKNLRPATMMITKTASKNKKKKVAKKLPEVALSEGFLLKLNYDDVRNAWSDRGSPFADGSPGNDITLRFSSAIGNLKSKRKQGAVREASMQRYKRRAMHASALRSTSGNNLGKSTQINGTK